MGDHRDYTFKDVQARCVVSEDINRHLIESWVASAKTLYKTAQIKQEEGQSEEAYVFYSRVYEICINMIPSHKDYDTFKKAPALRESYQSYVRFRMHLSDNMDQFEALRMLVRKSFKSQSNGTGSEISHRNGTASSHQSARPESANSITSRFAQLSTRSQPTPTRSPPQPSHVVPGLKPALPKAIHIDVRRLMDYIEHYPDISILFLDIRPRPDFDEGHIHHQNVINIDPLVCRPNVKSQDLEDSFVVGPDEEQKLFENRDKFDLVVIYDEDSKSFDPALASRGNLHADALANALKALYEHGDWRKPLARSPVLLLGGLTAWQSAGGVLKQTSIHEDDGNPGNATNTASLIVQQPYYSSPDVSAKRKHRGTSIVQEKDSPFPRSIQEYISNYSTGQQSMRTSLRPLGPRSPMAVSPPIQNNAYLEPRTPPITAPLRFKKRENIGSPYLESPDSLTPARQGIPAFARQPSLGSQTSRLGQTTVGKTGLKNLGNSCFMNAVLQCLAACFPLARYFTSGQWRGDVNLNNPLGYKGAIAKQFALLLRELISDDNTVIAPVDLRTVIGRSRPEFAKGDQQDAQELMNFLLDALHEDLNEHASRPQLRELTEAEERHRESLPLEYVSKTEWDRHAHRNMSIIVKLFQGQLQSRLECSVCHHTSTTYNPFTTLSLPIPQNKRDVTLDDCIKEFTKVEAMENDDSWYCTQCRLKRTASKKLSISRVPDVLLIHFKRFEAKGPWRDKLNTEIGFPSSSLDLRPYVLSPVGATYDLFGVVYHRGSMEGGHYTAIVNPEASRNQEWTLFDDSRIAPSTGIDGRAAYLLFYAKRAEMM